MTYYTWHVVCTILEQLCFKKFSRLYKTGDEQVQGPLPSCGRDHSLMQVSSVPESSRKESPHANKLNWGGFDISTIQYNLQASWKPQALWGYWNNQIWQFVNLIFPPKSGTGFSLILKFRKKNQIRWLLTKSNVQPSLAYTTTWTCSLKLSKQPVTIHYDIFVGGLNNTMRRERNRGNWKSLLGWLSQEPLSSIWLFLKRSLHLWKMNQEESLLSGAQNYHELQ